MSDSAPLPRCGFESWFDPSPTSSSSRPHYRVHPRVAAVESEVTDRAAALHRRSKPLLAVLPRKVRRYAVADQPHFAAPQPVNPSFSRLAGVMAVGSKRWGSVTFAEMERLERLFRTQLDATSSSLWMMSGILAMLKRDGFNPYTPGLFNTAISSVSASLAFQARTVASGSVFLRAKHRESLLAHSKVPIPEPQKRALIVTPGSDSGVFSEPLLDSVAAQVKEDSLVWKTSGSWRPVIDLSHLNRFVDVSHFQMETIQSVLLSVRQGDWMASIDLREAYLQVPVHPESRHFLRFVAHGRAYQFKALCFGLSTAPQVFTRVMAPVSAILHSLGIRMRRYLDNWLVQSSSRVGLLRDLRGCLVPLSGVGDSCPTDGLLPCCGGGACEVRRRTGQW